MNPEIHKPTRLTGAAYVVDNSDWLKATAIFLVAVGHFGYFFIDDAGWWSVSGRMAAPIFFFLMGYAQSRTIPFSWIWLGVILTMLDSWNNEWMWVAPNILFSMVLIRLARPRVKMYLQKYGWAAFALIVFVLLAVLPLAAEIVDYGGEGWLWALFGLCHRIYVDGSSATVESGKSQSATPSTHTTSRHIQLMRLLACFTAAVVYIWQEQIEFSFSQVQLNTVILGVVFMSITLCLFRRAPSRFQPPGPAAGALHFLGWHTLEIYVIQLAGSELIIKFLPHLSP